MGIGSGGTDIARAFTSGTLTSAAAGAGMYVVGNFNISVSGTFVATLIPERSFDGGTTYLPLAFSDGTTISYSAPASATWSEPETGVLYRVRCSAFTSGTIAWRISQ